MVIETTLIMLSGRWRIRPGMPMTCPTSWAPPTGKSENDAVALGGSDAHRKVGPQDCQRGKIGPPRDLREHSHYRVPGRNETSQPDY
jgi:hypothetical protein